MSANLDAVTRPDRRRDVAPGPGKDLVLAVARPRVRVVDVREARRDRAVLVAVFFIASISLASTSSNRQLMSRHVRARSRRMLSDWIKRSSNRWPNRNVKLAFPVNFKLLSLGE